jgi:hypothetical protein
VAEVNRYVDVTAQLQLDGKAHKLRVQVDLLQVAHVLGPKALSSKRGLASYWQGAVKVSVVK